MKNMIMYLVLSEAPLQGSLEYHKMFFYREERKLIPELPPNIPP